MTKQECKDFVTKTLKDSFCDDLARAKSAFRGLDANKMNEEYGESGMTRQDIVNQYEADHTKREEALKWLLSVSV